MHSETALHSDPAMSPWSETGSPGVTAGDVLTEAFVLVAMALATLAVGTSLYLQFDLSFVAAVVCGLSVYLGLLATHALVHRNSAVGALKAELAHLETHFARATGIGRQGDGHSDMQARARLGGNNHDAFAAPPPADTLSVNSPPPSAANPLPDLDATPAITELQPPTLPSPNPAAGYGPATAEIEATKPSLTNSPPPLAPAAEPKEPVRDASSPERDEPELDAIETRAPQDPSAHPPRESDVEMVRGLIKKLADEVNASDSAQRPAPTPIASMAQPQNESENASAKIPSPAQKPRGPVTIASQLVAPAAPSTDETPYEPTHDENVELAPAIPEATDQETDVSVDALRTAADTMRDVDDKFEAEDQSPTNHETTGEQGVPSDPGIFAIISEALNTGRVDVLLDPILGLDNRRARHFEISLRLRDIDNTVIDTQAHTQDLVGTGLNTLLDRATLSRTATVALQLDSRGRSGAVFSKITGQSFGTQEFVSDVYAAFHEHESLAGQLVMTLSQAHVRSLGAHEWTTLADLKTLGFRFAVSSVTDLDMDFEELSEKGFAFVKLDAEVFLKGLLTSQTRVPASDICSHLAGMNLTAIVEHIDDDDVLAQLSGFGVEFGQGQLFGGPRTVKAQALKSTKGTAAA